MNIIKAGELLGHKGPVYTLVKSVRPMHIYSGGSDGLAVEWDVKTMDAGAVIAKVEGVIYCITPIGERFIAIGTDKGGIHIIDLELKKEIKYLLNHTNGVFDILYLAKHKKFVALGGDGAFSVWDSHTYLCEATIKLCDAKLRNADIDTTETEIAIACGDNTVRIFNIDTWTETHRLDNHNLSVNSVKYHPNGQFLLTGSRDAHLNIYDVKGYNLYKSIPAHNFAIYSIAFNNDASLFATGSRDKTAKIWDADTFDIKLRISKDSHNAHINSVNKVLWDDDYLITTGDDRAIFIWKVE